MYRAALPGLDRTVMSSSAKPPPANWELTVFVLAIGNATSKCVTVLAQNVQLKVTVVLCLSYFSMGLNQ